MTPVQVYRRIYFEALDLIVSSIEERFDQPSFKAYSNMESLLLVNPATSATGERSFFMARRVKTWLRANMKQQRFNNVALLHTHKARTDKIRLLDVANEFVQRNENRFRNFGKLIH